MSEYFDVLPVTIFLGGFATFIVALFAISTLESRKGAR